MRFWKGVRAMVKFRVLSRIAPGVVWSGARLRARACAVLVACALGVSVLMGAGPVLAGNADGTPDTTFTTNIGTGFNNDVYAVAVQSDGKIIVGGCGVGGGRGEPNDQPHSNGGEDSFFQGDLTSL